MVQPLCADRLVTLNDRRIASQASAILMDGDTIAYGTCVVRFEERPAPQLMDAEKIDRLRTILQPHLPGRRRSLAHSFPRPPLYSPTAPMLPQRASSGHGR